MCNADTEMWPRSSCAAKPVNTDTVLLRYDRGKRIFSGPSPNFGVWQARRTTKRTCNGRLPYLKLQVWQRENFWATSLYSVRGLRNLAGVRACCDDAGVNGKQFATGKQASLERLALKLCSCLDHVCIKLFGARNPSTHMYLKLP
jgi:hypothetical protein